MNYVVTFTDKNCIENVMKVWLPTLQKNFSGKIVVIVFDVIKEHIEQLKNQGVIVIEEDSTISGLYKTIKKRLEVEEKFIKTLEDDDKIMLIDGADVVFQSEIDTFFNCIDDKIYYSTTGTLSNNSTIKWFEKAFENYKEKPEFIKQIKKEEIKASGMLAGSKISFINYFKKQRQFFRQFDFKYFTGINQVILTCLILKYPDKFKETDIHNCRILNKNIKKENGVYKIKKIIPIIHFSCRKMKKIYANSYLNNNKGNIVKNMNNINILWLYGSIPKFDAINHWYHLDFARILAKQPNINLMVYGNKMHELHPDIAKIPFNSEMTGKDLKKEFDFDVIIMDNKNRFISGIPKTIKEKKYRDFWLKPEFFKDLNNIPKIFLEGDYHLHFKRPEEKNWYSDRKVDLLLVRHLTALDYHKDSSMPIKWFPCSVNENIFKPNKYIQRKNKICLISGYGLAYYKYRNTAGGILETVQYREKQKIIDIYPKRFIGDDYIKNLQSYICHLSGSSIRVITPAKMFEIMASGSVLLTDEGWEYGLKELFPDNSYCTYKRDFSDLIINAKKIINEPEFREYTTTKALKCIKTKHTHEIRAKELITIITKTFGITYNKEPSKNIFDYIGAFFKKTDTDKQLLIRKNIEETNTEPKINDNPTILQAPIGLKNEEKLKRLYNKKIEIYLLKDTCYNIVINNKTNNFSLDIAVDDEKKAEQILGNDFIFNAIPKNTKKFVYKNMNLNIPYPIVKYLQKHFGKEGMKALKRKRQKLFLLGNTYKFINRK